ncbi:MAG: DUF4331 domain-containing protein [Chroococcidiopsidaceae cyanobacterium CP_BM_ER_R8_30]|nr:DUF4331 domain-containing protein [Chroococcidiopsidaceae cyanobacterium CP_BM_ER_R8_30]
MRLAIARLFQTTAVFIATLSAVLLCVVSPALASDHQDTTFLATKLTAADLTDLFVFEDPANTDNVVLAMDFDPLIVAGEVRPFDPSVLYQFKIDSLGNDGVEDVVLQFMVNGTGPNQTVIVYGPGKPNTVGTQSTLLPASGTSNLNTTFTTSNGVTTFVGLRKDPFFFDLSQFLKIIPDRDFHNQPDPPPPFQVLSFRPAGQAQDTLDPYNVHSIVVELPKKLLLSQGSNGKIGVWMTTSVKTPRLRDGSFAQIERLAIPALNELFMDFQAHNVSNLQTPKNDQSNQSNFIRTFIATVGRPKGISDAVVAVAIPDVIQADLNQSTGVYFGTQLASLGAAPPNLGGRRPKDDVIDTTLSVVFGSAVTNITAGAIPTLTTDNVGPKDSNFLSTFPYLGNPRT